MTRFSCPTWLLPLRKPPFFFAKIGLLVLILVGDVAAGFTQGLRFDGRQTVLVLRNSARLVNPGAFTVETWVNFADWYEAPDMCTIVSSEDPDSYAGFAFRAGGTRGQPARLSFTHVVRGAWTETLSPPLLHTGRWYHVAAVVEPERVTLYLDGRRVGRSMVLPGYLPSRRDLRVGESPFENHRWLNGVVDDLRIWNKARTEAEIFRDRTAVLRGNEPGLLAYFSMEKSEDGIPKNRVANAVRGEFQIGDGGWASGYAPVVTDVGVVQIDGPDLFTARHGAQRIQVTVHNYATVPTKAVPLVYRLNGREVLRDTLRVSLSAGTSVVHKTRVPVDCLPGESSRLEVFSALPGDEWAKNDTAQVAYRRPPAGDSKAARRVTVFDSVPHYFRDGEKEAIQFRFARVVLPEDNARYGRILMHVSVACPEKGCDPWDQLGQMRLYKAGEIYELGRFVTPYGVACGPWTLDVTDFKSVLRGHCLIESYVRAFTPRGWKLSVWFEFLDNVPNPYPHQHLTSLWQHDYLLYGDPRFDTHQQLPPVALQLAPRTRAVTFRHTITGHGQDNTDNANEFARKTHHLVLKRVGRADSTVIPHLLWRSDCAQNPCTGQKGSYTYSRAGWCPGQEVRPFAVSLPVAPGVFTLSYQFQPYRNARLATRENYVSLPSFVIHSYLVEKSDSLRGFTRYRNVACRRLDRLGDQLLVQVVNTGTEAVAHLRLHGFRNGVPFTRELLAEPLRPNEVRTVTLAARLPAGTRPTDTLAVLADDDGDENAGDDVANLRP